MAEKPLSNATVCVYSQSKKKKIAKIDFIGPNKAVLFFSESNLESSSKQQKDTLNHVDDFACPGLCL